MGPSNIHSCRSAAGRKRIPARSMHRSLTSGRMHQGTVVWQSGHLRVIPLAQQVAAGCPIAVCRLPHSCVTLGRLSRGTVIQ